MPLLGSFTGATHVDVLKEFNILASATGKPNSNPMADSHIGTYAVILADDTTEEYAFFSFQVPNNWKEGSDIEVHFHCINVAGQTGSTSTVIGIQYSAVGNNQDATPTPTTVEVTHNLQNNQAAETMFETAPLTIIGSNLNHDDSVGIKMYRKAASVSDTMTGDLAFDGIHIVYTSDKL